MFRNRKEKSIEREKEPNLLKDLAEAMENVVEPTAVQPKDSEDKSVLPLEPTEDIAGIRSRDGSEPRSYKSYYSDFDLDDALRRLSHEDSFKATISDALGRLMIENSAQVQQLSKKAHVPFHKTPEKTCDEFADHLTQQDEKISQMINQHIDPLKDMIKTLKEQAEAKPVNYHNRSETIFPPTEFNEYDTLENNERKLAQANFEFPIKTKFNGKKCVEFLRRMNAAQKRVKLSENEFKEYLLKCTTDDVFDDLVALVDGEGTIQDMYNLILDNFDDRKSPADAKEDLDTLIPEQDATLRSVTQQIQKLGLRAKLIYAKEAQDQGYHHDTVQTLLKCLPKGSYHDGLKHYTKLAISSPNGIPQFRSFCQALREVEPVINHNYQMEKHNRVAKMEASKRKTFAYVSPFKRIQARYQKTHGRGKIQQLESRPNKPFEGGYRGNRPFNNNPERPRNSDQRPRDNQGRDQPNYIQYKYPSKNKEGFEDRNRDNRRNNNPNKMALGVKGKLHCSLCSSSTHSAAQGCFKMRNDAGKLVFCPPSQGACARCETMLGKSLFHPSSLCFMRPRYKQLVEEGKIKYPTFSERKEMQTFIKGQEQ